MLDLQPQARWFNSRLAHYEVVTKVKGAMPQLGRGRGAHLPLAAVEPVGG